MYFSSVKLNALKRAPIFIAAGVTGLVCLAQVLRPEFLERLERMTYDLRVREAVRHSPVMATNLGFVYISNDTIKDVSAGLVNDPYGLYWPRQIYGRVARELHSEGAKAVAFDVLFGELRPDHPPVLVVATAMLGDKMGVRTDPLQLARLLETQVIEIAVIDGADPVANVPGKSDPARELFAQNYRILRRPR